jgi:hypothetical protein
LSEAEFIRISLMVQCLIYPQGFEKSERAGLFKTVRLSLFLVSSILQQFTFSSLRVHKCVKNGGKILIPVFALGRAQELCLLLEVLIHSIERRVVIYNNLISDLLGTDEFKGFSLFFSCFDFYPFVLSHYIQRFRYTLLQGWLRKRIYITNFLSIGRTKE